ncbi:MAG TPA: uracil-DNA glycosylase [Terriglobia bacterium]|nr:uracil-DNA glycosylase [Terriglobia bacterium]
MDAQTKQQIADWLSFFRDLGFEDLYRRPQAAGAQLPPPQMKMPAPPAAAQTATVPVASSITPLVAPRLAVPAATPKTLSLFEAPETSSAASSSAEKMETLEEIRTDLGDCHRCKLWKGRKHIVFGQGNPRAELIFIGEGPGADEDEQGLPFVGRAGQLLNKMLQLVQIKREDIYICNVVKCRPPGNRTPESDEIAACSPFLFRQIDAIHPRIICCLGAPAAHTVLGIKEGITKVHGQFFDYRGAKAMATVHPAYVLRNPREEVILRDDFAKIRDFLKSPIN